MVVLQNPKEMFIKPYSLYTYTKDAESYFLNRFKQDKLSFYILHYLIRYCCEFNQGEWATITPQVLHRMEIDSASTIKRSISIKESELFKEGMLVEDGNNFLLTHEFILDSYMATSDGNFLPLSTGHIDTSGTGKLISFFKEVLKIRNNTLIDFLTRVAVECTKKSGILLDSILQPEKVTEIAKEVGVIPIIAVDTSFSYGILSLNEDTGQVLCNGLMWMFYRSSPRLS